MHSHVFRFFVCSLCADGSEGLLAHAVHPGAVITPQTENHSLQKGDVWDAGLTDDVALCGGFLTWLTKDRKDWLSGRYISVTWDVDELEKMKVSKFNGERLD